MVTETDHWFLA